MSTVTKEPKTRRSKARHRDIVVGCIEERILMLTDTADTSHKERLLVLLDELRRSLDGKEEE